MTIKEVCNMQIYNYYVTAKVTFNKFATKTYIVNNLSSESILNIGFLKA